MTYKPTVAVDFDGVIHPYTDGWQGPIPTDEPPTDGAEDFFLDLLDDGYEIVVFSARACDDVGRKGICEWLKRWHLWELVADVVHTKPHAVAYIDDRAVPFVGTWEGIREAVDNLSGWDGLTAKREESA